MKGVTWELTSMVTADRPAMLSQVPTMKFEGTRVAGQTGCNTFSARASVLTQSMTFGPFFQSRRACSDAERVAQEQGFLELMQQVIRCNRVFGTLQQSGPVVTFKTVGTTRLTCDAARTEQEDALIQVLNSPLTITRTAQRLVLSSSAGDIELLRRDVAKTP